MMISQDTLVALVNVAKDSGEVIRSVEGKTGAWYDKPALIAVLGMIWHTYIKWQDKRRRPGDEKLTFIRYAFAKERMGAIILGLTLIGLWTINVGISGYNIRDILPYHWVTALAMGYMMDSLVKETVKKLPFLGNAFGIRLRADRVSGDLTISEPMKAVPPPPGFNNEGD